MDPAYSASTFASSYMTPAEPPSDDLEDGSDADGMCHELPKLALSGDQVMPDRPQVAHLSPDATSEPAPSPSDTPSMWRQVGEGAIERLVTILPHTVRSFAALGSDVWSGVAGTRGLPQSGLGQAAIAGAMDASHHASRLGRAIDRVERDAIHLVQGHPVRSDTLLAHDHALRSEMGQQGVDVAPMVEVPVRLAETGTALAGVLPLGVLMAGVPKSAMTAADQFQKGQYRETGASSIDVLVGLAEGGVVLAGGIKLLQQGQKIRTLERTAELNKQSLQTVRAELSGTKKAADQHLDRARGAESSYEKLLEEHFTLGETTGQRIRQLQGEAQFNKLVGPYAAELTVNEIYAALEPIQASLANINPTTVEKLVARAKPEAGAVARQAPMTDLTTLRSAAEKATELAMHRYWEAGGKGNPLEVKTYYRPAQQTFKPEQVAQEAAGLVLRIDKLLKPSNLN